jgi:hypothetical protein
VISCAGFNQRKVLIPVALALVALVLTVTTLASVTDGAYITYRHVRNIVTGQGFLYHTGEPVLGTATPRFSRSSTTTLKANSIRWKETLY